MSSLVVIHLGGTHSSAGTSVESACRVNHMRGFGAMPWLATVEDPIVLSERVATRRPFYADSRSRVILYCPGDTQPGAEAYALRRYPLVV